METNSTQLHLADISMRHHDTTTFCEIVTTTHTQTMFEVENEEDSIDEKVRNKAKKTASWADLINATSSWCREGIPCIA